MRRSKALAIGLVVVVVYALHQDFWNWQRIQPVFLGFVPVGLGYHVIYSLVAVALMWMLVKVAWPAELDRMESGEADRDTKDRS